MCSDPLAALLTDLGRIGVELAANGDQLRFRPRDRVGPDLLAWIRRLKPVLLALLSDPGQNEGQHENGSGPVVTEAIWEASYVFSERLGVADALGLPMGVGSPAWLIAMGAGIQAEYEVLTRTRNRRARTVGSRRFR